MRHTHNQARNGTRMIQSAQVMTWSSADANTQECGVINAVGMLLICQACMNKVETAEMDSIRETTGYLHILLGREQYELVALGNVLFTKLSDLWNDVQGWDACAPVCSTMSARFVEVRAWTSSVLRCSPIPPPCAKKKCWTFFLVSISPNVEYITAPVFPVVICLWRIMRHGFYCINGLGAFLRLTGSVYP